MDGIHIREAMPEDAAAICGIYNYYVLETAVSFEIAAVSVEGMAGRIRGVLGQGLPYFVAEAGGEVIGYCYLHPWRERAAYSQTRELTIYLEKTATGKGTGSLMMDRLLRAIDRTGTHTLVAGICLPNEASIRLHEKFGFRQVGCMRQVGRKFSRWWDVGYWQLIF